MFYQDNYVITGNCRIIWDGMTRPETLDDGGKKYSLKVATLASAPEVAEMEALLQRELQNGEFRGQLPPGALWGISDVRPGEFGDMLAGHKVFNTVTYNGAPDVYDINGQKLDSVHYNPMLYPGATVQLIVSARSYNNKSKGLGFWLNGIKIIDATSPKLPVAGGVDAGAAFGATGQGAPAGSTPQAPGANGAPNPGAAPSASPNTVAPAASAAGAVPGPNAAPPAPPAPVQPAHDFLNVNGQQFTADQLRGAGWTEDQINAVR